MHISIASVLLLLHISGAFSQGLTKWGTLTGEEPLVIARGGSSGLFPDQTLASYFDTVNNSLSSTLLYCDVQLSLDGFGICRTEINLDASTTISTYFNESKTYNFYGTPMKGYFAMDFESSVLLQIPVRQTMLSRAGVFDLKFAIVSPDNISSLPSLVPPNLWLNAEYPQFFAEQKLSMTKYMMVAMLSLPISYISSPEVEFLKGILAGAKKTKKKLIFKIPDMHVTEPTTNMTYSQILSNLTYVRSFADGILVPKVLIWPVSSDGFYVAALSTSLVKDAHKAGLLVFASGFASDSYPVPYNYTYDPVKEYLQFVSGSEQAVDGVLTDYPMTASAALACFSGNVSLALNSGSKPLVISHNGASGVYPGCTEVAYKEAVASGASFIDCPVQITQDGIPICRESANLVGNTDVSSHTEFYPQLISSSKPLNTTGIFAYNLTLKQISTLKATMFSPEGQFANVTRNPEYDGLYEILTLEYFLNYARNVTDVNIYIDIENGYIFENEMNIDIVGPVISVLEASGFKGSSRVWVQSEDSSVLRRFKELTNYTLVYRVAKMSAVSAATVLQIQELVSAVMLPKQLALYTDPTYGFLGNYTGIVESFRSRNLSVFVGSLKNEFINLAFDYELDPYLELHTLTQILKVDGFITDYPATARSYLNSECLKANSSSYSFHLVTPGRLFMDAQVNIPIIVPTYTAVEFSEPPLAPTTIAPVGALAPSSAPPPSSMPPSSTPPSPSNNSNSGIYTAPPHLLSNCLLLLLPFMYFSF